MITCIALVAFAPALVQGTVTEQGDLQRVVFDLPEGKLSIYLPDDIVPGDTLSGTVVAEPAGQGDLFDSNQAVLQGVVVDLAGNKPQKSGQRATWVLPASVAAVATLTLLNRNGAARGKAECMVLPTDFANVPTAFDCDPVSNAGAPLQVLGPFDGNTGNSRADCGGTALVPIAETPRSAVFSNLPKEAGPTKLSVSDGGANATLDCNMVTVMLSAGKTSLLRGDSTDLTMTVTGLQGLPESEYPLPYELHNQSPDVVRLDGIEGSVLAAGLPFEAVKNGTASVSASLIGIKPGAFRIRGVLFGVRLHDAKKLMDAASFRAWVAALIVSYDQKIQALEAELKESPNSTPLKLKLARVKGVMRVLQMCRNASNADLGACKDQVDKALADDAFFAMAGGLVRSAFDVISASTPNPYAYRRVRILLKGIRVVVAGTRFSHAVLRAQRIFDEAEAAADEATRRQKLRELLDALRELDSEFSQ